MKFGAWATTHLWWICCPPASAPLWRSSLSTLMKCEIVSCPSNRQDISYTWPGRAGPCSTSDMDPRHKCPRDVKDAHRIAIEEHSCHASSSSATLPGHRRTGLIKMGPPRNLPQNTSLFIVVSYPKALGLQRGLVVVRDWHRSMGHCEL
jgi:hypothetical protein